MSPLMISIMLECYCSGDPGANVVPEIWNSPAANAARSTLRSAGLIDADLRSTASGVEYVERLLAVPTPIEGKDT